MYVIYHRKSFRRFTTRDGTNVFAQEGTAKAIRTKAVKAGKIVEDDWVIATRDEWQAADPMIEVISVMTGSPVKIRSSDRGNPALDPSMEGYWQA